MKDFDEDRVRVTREQREFKIRGQVFVRREAVRPEATADFEDIKMDTGAHHTLEIIDRMILDFIEDTDDGHSRYLELRRQNDDPLTLDDLVKLANWVTGEVVGRPTGSPSGSSTGSGSAETGTPSTGVSSSQGELVSAA